MDYPKAQAMLPATSPLHPMGKVQAVCRHSRGAPLCGSCHEMTWVLASLGSLQADWSAPSSLLLSFLGCHPSGRSEQSCLPS